MLSTYPRSPLPSEQLTQQTLQHPLQQTQQHHIHRPQPLPPPPAPQVANDEKRTTSIPFSASSSESDMQPLPEDEGLQLQSQESRKKKNMKWVVGDASTLWKVHQGKKWSSFYGPLKLFESITRGFGQVCFANNPWTGILIFIGLLVAEPTVALGALLASITSLCVSRILDQPDDVVVSGLQNYSAVLVGSVTVSLFPLFFDIEMDWTTWVGIIAMAAFSVCVGLGLDVLLSHSNLPVYTLPFNVTASLLFLSIYYSGAVVPETEISNSTSTDIDMSLIFQGVLKSSGQVYAVESFWASALILIGLLINSPFLTVASFIGGLLSTFVATSFNTPPYDSLYTGVWGYNGFLSAGCIAFFVTPSFTSMFLIILSSTFTPLMQVALTPVFQFNTLPVFTFPFCITSLLFLALTERVPGVKRVKQLSYPEEHLWRARKESKRQR